MITYRVDESGYTGFNLLDKEQPIQGATAVGLSNEDAKILIERNFPELKAKELKFRSLIRRENNIPKIINLIREVLSEYSVVTYVCDKKYLLNLMFMDSAVEPFYYALGRNFYENGYNHAAASFFMRAGPSILGKTIYNNVIDYFQFAVKAKTAASLHKFVNSIKSANWKIIPEILGPIGKFQCPNCLEEISNIDSSTDAALTVMVAIISHLEKYNEVPYLLEHDKSKNLTKYHEVLLALIENKENKSFRSTKITSLDFPLKLKSVTQVDSKDSPAVQIADIIIGATIAACGKITGLIPNSLIPSDELLSLYKDEQFIWLFPSGNPQEDREFFAGSQGAETIDYLTNLISRKNSNE